MTQDVTQYSHSIPECVAFESRIISTVVPESKESKKLGHTFIARVAKLCRNLSHTLLNTKQKLRTINTVLNIFTLETCSVMFIDKTDKKI